ncbi:hypothetical protein [Pseudomonas nitroreducens]|uniref:Uncharacterized protein n=1 Tax=Pseudomonas nitroreducens TaxID=46680 RepID=A0A246F7K8_PSENT|nr:hypothetical protein [Pseudomonas nitroreducens]OWP49186.1 hypothetical protein CEG18_20865 [Pseudomonas nitroreducens]
MTIFIDWIDDKKKSTYVLTTLLIACYAAAYALPGKHWVALTALAGSIVLPFAIFLVWVIDSNLVERLLSRRWTAILFAGAVILYGMIANTFSSNLINDYFKVDPAHFTVTNVFLTTVYLFIGVFQPFVILPIWLALLLLSTLLIPAFIIMGSGLKALKRIGLYLLATFLVSASTQILGLLEKQLPTLAEKVALYSDFNEKHRCTAVWPASVDKVVFLYDGNVLAHISKTRNYEVFPCSPR